MKKFFYFIIILITALNCKAQENLRDFYYPFSDKTETKIYKYVDKNNVSKVEFWKVTAIPKSKELKTVSYDSNFNIYNTFYEKISKNGAELVSYSDFEINEYGVIEEIIAEVIDKDVYKWNGDKQYSYSVKYVNKYGLFNFKKIRKELGLETISVKGKELQAIKFEDEYIVLALDHDVEQRFHQDTYYVKNIGMIKYKRKIPIQHELIELELVQILSEKEFEKLIKANNN